MSLDGLSDYCRQLRYSGAMASLNHLLACLFITIGLFGGCVLADPSYGCSALIPKPVEWTPTPGEIKLFRVNDRQVRVTVPESYNNSIPAPIIIAYHDKDQPVEHLEYDGAWMDSAVNKDMIMVYPEAVDVR
jgi:hypothetical protein